MNVSPEKFESDKSEQPTKEPQPSKLASYRKFARAAKDERVNLSSQEVREIAKDPSTLLAETSFELQQKIKPETLVSFLNLLSGDKAAKSGDVLKIGNFLYSYRTDREKGSTSELELNARECQLINLACVLLENAFYAGKLSGLSEEQEASLAFTANVLAKILDQQANNPLIKGFDQAKLAELVGQAEEYEAKTLFPNAAPGNAKLPVEQYMEVMDAKINVHLDKAEQILTQIETEDYLGSLVNQLQSSVNEIYYLPRYTDDEKQCKMHEEVLSIFSNHKETLLALYRRSLRSRQVDTQTPPIRGNYDIKHGHGRIFSSLCKTLMNEVIDQETGRDRFNSISRLEELRDKTERMFDGLSDAPVDERAKFERSVARGYAPEYSDAEALLWDVGRDKTLKLIREIELTLYHKNPPAMINEFLEQLKETDDLLYRRGQVKGKHDAFNRAVARLKQRGDQPSNLAYLVKGMLLRSNMLQHRDYRWNALADYGFYEAYGQEDKGVPSHAMIGRKSVTIGEYYGTEGTNPAYATLHYLPEDMPLVEWIYEFQQSNKRSDKKAESGLMADEITPKPETQKPLVPEERTVENIESDRQMIRDQLEPPMMAMRSIINQLKSGKSKTSALHWLSEFKKISKANEEGLFDDVPARVGVYLKGKGEKITKSCKDAAKELGWNEQWFEKLSSAFGVLPEVIDQNDLLPELFASGIDKTEFINNVKKILLTKAQTGREVNPQQVIEGELDRLTKG